MDSLLLAPDLFSEEGGIARILRLYLKALCEMSADGDKMRFISLNDAVVDSADLRGYANDRLVEWRACNHSKLGFANAVRQMGMESDRIVCGHIAQLPLAWAVSKLHRGMSYYLVAHGIEVWRPFTIWERRALLGAESILCVSDYTRLQILKFCSIPPGRMVVMPNALDPALESSTAVKAPEDPPMILSISRLSVADSYKGIGHLIQAMPAVRQKIPGARLRIVGRGDGLPSLSALARSLGMENAVEFAGYRSDGELSEDFSRCRLFALPSQKEGFGLVYLEAMEHGRPCLGARSGGVPEVITADTGVLVEYGDVPGIAAAVVDSLRRDWDVGPILERARHFSYPRFRERLAAFLGEKNPEARAPL